MDNNSKRIFLNTDPENFRPLLEFMSTGAVQASRLTLASVLLAKALGMQELLNKFLNLAYVNFGVGPILRFSQVGHGFRHQFRSILKYFSDGHHQFIVTSNPSAQVEVAHITKVNHDGTPRFLIWLPGRSTSEPTLHQNAYVVTLNLGARGFSYNADAFCDTAKAMYFNRRRIPIHPTDGSFYFVKGEAVAPSHHMPVHYAVLVDSLTNDYPLDNMLSSQVVAYSEDTIVRGTIPPSYETVLEDGQWWISNNGYHLHEKLLGDALNELDKRLTVRVFSKKVTSNLRIRSADGWVHQIARESSSAC